MKKCCVVPKCCNNSVKTPNKMFFYVPREPKMLRKWMTMMGRKKYIKLKSSLYCCEDHFDIENDMENYVKYKLVGGKLKLKKGTVPHKFAWQVKSVKKPQPKKLEVEDIENACENASTSQVNTEMTYIVDPDIGQNDDIDPLKDAEVNYNIHSESKNIVNRRHKKTQANIKNKVQHKYSNTDKTFFNLPPNTEKNTENKKQLRMETSSVSTNSFSDYDISSDSANSNDIDFEKESFRVYMNKAALLCISREPQLLLGIPKQWYCCIEMLSQSCQSSARDIMIVLKKIRLHQSNEILALDFGIDDKTLGKIVRKKIPIIASCMRTLVFFPKSEKVLANLPMPFRKRYSNVQSIIDCLEIQIEKPTNAVKQSLTWSEYKSCNTIKYLISITPDGLINYISEGYGGRTTDSVIFEDCGILDLLPENAAVMADRGFKNVAHLLQQKGVTLVRPPTVSSTVTPTQSEVHETKKIAALRIHVERTIGRLRNFGFLMPHATVDMKQVDLLDYVVETACGIINLQNSLFKLRN